MENNPFADLIPKNSGSATASNPFADLIPQPKQQQPLTQEQAGLTSFIEGIPFGNDIASGIGAAYARFVGGVPLSEGYSQARDLFHQEQKAAKEQYPTISLASNVVGGVTSGFLLPASALQAPTVLGRAIKGAGVGFGYGAAYGSDKGDTLEQRTGNALQEGIISAPLGAASSVATDAIIRGVSAFGGYAKGPLTQKAEQYLNRRRAARAAVQDRVPPTVTNDTIATMQEPLNKPVNMDMTKEYPIPLTQGNLTQNPKQQALEAGAAAGNYGDEAQQTALRARELQSNAAKDVLQKAAGGEIGDMYKAGANIKQILSSSYKAAKQKTNAAYKTVERLSDNEPLKIGANYIKQTVVPSLDDLVKTGFNGRAYDLNELPKAKVLYEEAKKITKIDKVNAVNFDAMEQWRSKVTQRLAQAQEELQPGVKNSVETVFLGKMLNRYDDAMTALPREAIKSGDEAIVDAYTRARAARANQGATFERNKIVMDVLKNEDVTNEQLVNIVFGGKGKMFNPKSGFDIKKLMAASGDKSQEVLSSFKNGVYSKILRNSLDAREIKAGTTEEMISFDKLATNLKDLIQENKTLFNQIHPDPAEREYVQKALDAAKMIKSQKPGTKNYSNSAYTLLNFMRQISPSATKTGMFGMNMEKAATSIGQGVALEDLKRSLAPVLKESADQLNGKAFKFMERFAPSAAVSSSVNLKNQSKNPEVTIYGDVNYDKK